MNPVEVARLYVMAADLDESARQANDLLQEHAASLRSELHALLMRSLREAKIPFADRSEAAAWAYRVTNGPVVNDEKIHLSRS